MTVIPFTDIGAMARETWPLIERDYMECMLSGGYIGGPAVEAFERNWASYCGTDYAVGVANGTDALRLTLTALGIGAGDEVIVPANTFIATAAAVVHAGAVPRFADVSDDTLLMSPLTLKAVITPRTRAIIVVHLYGQMPDMTGIMAIAAGEGIPVIEDAAQAHGAEWAGQRAGSFGEAACFSFYPAKNVGAFGDAGVVVTSCPELAHRIRSLANHGRSRGSEHYVHDCVGTNSRLDALQAIALSGKLKLNEQWTQRRIEIAARYCDQLSSTAVRPLAIATEARHVYHLFVIRVAARDLIRAEIARLGVQTGVHYPVACHLQPPLRRFAESELPVAERASGEVLSLPLFPHMSDAQVDAVCESVNQVIGMA